MDTTKILVNQEFRKKMGLDSIESMSMIETENLYQKVKVLLDEKLKCELEIDTLTEQRHLDAVKIESLTLQLEEMHIENDSLRQERLKEMSAFNINHCLNAELRYENDRLKSMNEKLSQENVELRLLAEELAILKPKHSELVLKYDSLEKDYIREKNINESLHRRLTQAQVDLDNARKQNAELRALNEELSILAAELAELKPRYATIIAKYDVIEKELLALRSQYADLLRRSEEMAARILSLEKDLEDLTAQYNALRDEHEKTLEALEGLKHDYRVFSEKWSEELETLRREGTTYARIVERLRMEEARTKPCIFCSPVAKYHAEPGSQFEGVSKDGRSLRTQREEYLNRALETEEAFQRSLLVHHNTLHQLRFNPNPH